MADPNENEAAKSLTESLQRRFLADYHKVLNNLQGFLDRDYQEVLVDIKKDLVDLKELRHRFIEQVYNNAPGETGTLDPKNPKYKAAKSDYAQDVQEISQRLSIHIEQLQKDKGIIEGAVREAAQKFRQILIDNSYLDKQAAQLLILLHRVREGVFALDAPESDVNKSIGLVNNEFDFARDEKAAISKANDILKKLDKEL